MYTTQRQIYKTIVQQCRQEPEQIRNKKPKLSTGSNRKHAKKAKKAVENLLKILKLKSIQNNHTSGQIIRDAAEPITRDTAGAISQAKKSSIKQARNQ